ncbi:MAG TPA: GNAT family protein [Pyrinomonadaceae bacterium]|nr:GNAT family protein [Pyrinomonadaceae bacterium]
MVSPSADQKLTSERLALTQVTQADLPVLLEWINNRELVSFNAPYKPVSEREHHEWFQSIQQRSDTRLFAIRRLGDAKLIGSCQLHTINPVSGSAELQIRLGDPAEFGQGYGTEAVRLLLKFGFNDLKLRRIYLQVFATNLRAIRVYEKVGFVREGVLRQAAYINGEYLDVVMMGILFDEYVREQSSSNSPA